LADDDTLVDEMKVTLLPPAISVAFLAYFWLTGFGLISLLHSQRDVIRNALLAPAAGVSVTILSVYFFSRAGLPVRDFAWPLTLAIAAASALVLILRRPLLPKRRLVPYLLVALFAIIVGGWPLFVDGFAWLGNVNPDLTNYVLGAHRLVNEAYIQAPDPSVWADQSDWSIYYGEVTAAGIRSGSELLLAWAIALTGRNGLEIYMPLLVALDIALIFAATALVGTPYRFARLLSAVLLATAAMLTLGVTFQLIAQLLGLILLVLACTLGLSPFYRLQRGARVRYVMLLAIALASLTLTYPEILPFFGIAFLVYHGVRYREIAEYKGQVILSVAAVGILAFTLIAPDVFGLATFFLYQLRASGSEQALPELFPYFLMPSGAAALWGLYSFSSGVGGASLTVATIFGFALSGFAVVASAWLVWRAEPAAAVLLVMFAVGLILFFGDAGFGTLKLAMYAQPFMLPVTVLAICRLLGVAR
jgi:hypothetical protein